MTESKFEAVLTQAFHEYVDEKLEINSCNIEEFKTSERFEKSIKRMIKNNSTDDSGGEKYDLCRYSIKDKSVTVIYRAPNNSAINNAQMTK